MKEIDDYLKSLYRHFNATNKEIDDFRVEMKNHLLDSVRELQTEGKSVQESIQIAIERFGDPGQIGRELPEILMVSRRRFSRLILTFSTAALVIIVSLSIISYDNLKKQEKIQQSELTRQKLTQELQQSTMDNHNYSLIFDKISEIMDAYGGDSEQIIKDLNAKYNIPAINRIAEMYTIFKYHNAVLIGVAIIAADTDYECPLFKDIAELGVMKLSDSLSVINLAEKAREAKTEKDRELVKNQIQQMKAQAELKTYQQALDYNKKLMEQ